MTTKTLGFLCLVVLACTCKGSPVRQPPGATGGTGGGAGQDAGGSAIDAAAGAGAEALPDAPDDFDGGVCVHPPVIARCQDRWCEIPAGCFVMGSPDSEWEHAPQERRMAVTLSRPFRIGRYEVTQAEWTAAGFANPSGTVTDSKGVLQGDCTNDPTCPVGNVTWYEAVSYANRLSEREGLPPCYRLQGCVGEIGKDPVGLQCQSFELTTPTIYDCAGYRLPTDAEWEYAARAGARTAYYGGDISTRKVVGACAREPALDPIAWYCSNAGNYTHPVGKLAANGWGLFDIFGNAVEWSHDAAGRVPTTVAVTDLDWTSGSGQARDTRGCGFFGWPSLCRAASRIGASANSRAAGIGLRLARRLDP